MTGPLERTANNRKVRGSSPRGATYFCVSCIIASATGRTCRCSRTRLCYRTRFCYSMFTKQVARAHPDNWQSARATSDDGMVEPNK